MINKPKLLNEMLVNTPINAWVSTPYLWKYACYYLTLPTNQVTSLNHFFFCGEILPHKTALLDRYPSAVVL